jgi:glucoamylase
MARSVLAALNLLAVTQAAKFVPRATGSLDTWLASETSIALNGVLDNIGSSGAFTEGISSGVVVASPSQVDPDCKSSLV